MKKPKIKDEDYLRSEVVPLVKDTTCTQPGGHIYNAHQQCQWCHRMKAEIVASDVARRYLALLHREVTVERLARILGQEFQREPWVGEIDPIAFACVANGPKYYLSGDSPQGSGGWRRDAQRGRSGEAGNCRESQVTIR